MCVLPLDRATDQCHDKLKNAKYALSNHADPLKTKGFIKDFPQVISIWQLGIFNVLDDIKEAEKMKAARQSRGKRVCTASQFVDCTALNKPSI